MRYIFLNNIYSQYTHMQNLQNILQILQADNVFREIPQVYRDNLELDVQGGLVNRKFVVARDLLLQIQSLNLVRKILDNSIILGDYITEIKAAGTKGLDILFWVKLIIFTLYEYLLALSKFKIILLNFIINNF